MNTQVGLQEKIVTVHGIKPVLSQGSHLDTLHVTDGVTITVHAFATEQRMYLQRAHSNAIFQQALGTP